MLYKKSAKYALHERPVSLYKIRLGQKKEKVMNL
jgi:hypothetical protein